MALGARERERCIDRRRVFATGMSNGGFLSHRLGCELADRMAAIPPVAGVRGITLRDGRVAAEGDLDFRGTLGVAKDAPVGFRQIRLNFEVESDASEEQLATLLRLTERYCVVYQTLRSAPPIDVALKNEAAG